MEAVTNGGGKLRPEPTQTPPEPVAVKPRPRKAECRAFRGTLGGKYYMRGDVVTLTNKLEGEALANPTTWRVF